MLTALSYSGISSQKLVSSNESSIKGSLVRFLKSRLESPREVFSLQFIQGIYEFCIGSQDLSSGIEDRLLEECLERIAPSFALIIRNFQKQNHEESSMFFSHAFLKYAEKIQRKGFLVDAQNIRDFAVKLALLAELIELNIDVKSGLEKCLKKAEEIELRILDLSNLSVQELDVSYIQLLIQKTVPKKTLEKNIQDYSLALKPHLQGFLTKNIFEDKKNFTSGLQLLNLRNLEESFIWMHTTPLGIYLIINSGESKITRRSSHVKECLVSDIFIPKTEPLIGRGPKVGSSRLVIDNKMSKALFSLELKNRKTVFEIPLAEKYFTSSPILNTELCFLVKKATGCKSFQLELERSFKTLSQLDVLQVLYNVALGVQSLADAKKVSLDISPENITFKLQESGGFLGQIDQFLQLTSPGLANKSKDERKNALAKEGYISFETDRYALVVLIAEAFFLNLQTGIPLIQAKWEADSLKELEGLIYDQHYQTVLRLNSLYEGFYGDFSKDLFKYIEDLVKEEEESFQIVALKQFAFKAALFPEISGLLLETLEADAMHQKLFNEGKLYEEILSADCKIPSIERICSVLQNGIAKLQSIVIRQERSSCEEISLESVELIVEKICLNQYRMDKSAWIRDLHQILNEYIRDNPYVGSEIRLHKDTLWMDGSSRIPLSMWVQVQKSRVILEIFPPEQPSPLGKGAYKKVKENIQVNISEEGDVTFSPIAIYRLIGNVLNQEVTAGIKLQERLLTIPNAKNYLLGLSKKHASYQVGDKMKLESVFARFNGTLSTAIKSQSIQVETETLKLTTFDFIDFLQNIGKGLDLIAKEGVSHGDIKSANIAALIKEGKPVSFIFDFDLAASFGKSSIKDNYWDWNTIRQKYGVISKETDVYGYVLMIAESLLFGFKEFLQGSNQERSINFQKIFSSSRDANRQMRLIHAKEIQKQFPDLMTKERVLLLSEPPLIEEITSSHEELFESVKILQAEGHLSAALALKRFLMESLFFEKVFNLLNKTFLADRLSELDLIGNQERMSFEEAAELALKDAGFPTLDEIQEVLTDCKRVAEDVEFQSTKQESLLTSIFSYFGWT